METMARSIVQRFPLVERNRRLELIGSQRQFAGVVSQQTECMEGRMKPGIVSKNPAVNFFSFSRPALSFGHCCLLHLVCGGDAVFLSWINSLQKKQKSHGGFPVAGLYLKEINRLERPLNLKLDVWLSKFCELRRHSGP